MESDYPKIKTEDLYNDFKIKKEIKHENDNKSIELFKEYYIGTKILRD